MSARRVLVTLLVLAIAGTCVRLGVWQLSRWREKRALNAATRAALSAAPIELSGASPPFARVASHRVLARGSYDTTATLMLSDRWRQDRPGVEVIAPLRLAGGGVVLVDRGWLPAADGIDGHEDDFAAHGELRVSGLPEPLPPHARDAAWTALHRGNATAWSARRLAADTAAARVRAPLAPFVLRELPDDSAPAMPIRDAPSMLNEGMHLSYAIQWFAIAALVLGGGWALARRGETPPSVASRRH